MGIGRARAPACVVLLAAVGVGGYLLGHRSPTRTLIGPGIVIGGEDASTAYLGSRLPAPNASPVPWSYGVPDVIQWTDRSGVLHDMSRPTCLRVGYAVRVRQIEAVQYAIPSDGRTGTVLWLHC